jgi:hypothetical protein
MVDLATAVAWLTHVEEIGFELEEPERRPSGVG